ncbi:ABC transporter ATP-binding protein [Ardenticatena maritima]|uniref:ABC transporter ATP-binding protein n=1 Tax=Ardenticatena maritima TaxID=872965 RepID=UPI00191C11C7|nr:ABC transporter ATP-binding protein [Ardenticatena maritima]
MVFRNVSKRFWLDRSAGRTWQERFIALVRRHRQPREQFWALRDVSFAIEQGSMVGLIGPNGSGKSTTLKLMTGILEPTHGVVEVNGRIAALLELGTGFHPEMTGRENVFLNGALFGFSRDEMRKRLDDIVAFAELEQFIDMPVKHYSSGMFVRLAFAVAVFLDPEILVVDEVLAVGDAAFQHKCLDHIARLRRKGTTIVLVTHDLNAVETMCDRVIWFEKGQVVADGAAHQVVRDYLAAVAARDETLRSVQTPSGASDGQRWGTGRITIEAVELLDGSGQARHVFFTGEPMTIRLVYVAHEPIQSPVFGLAIHHQNGAHVCGPNTFFGGLDLGVVEGRGAVEYVIPSLPLLEGGYVLSVSAHTRDDSEMFDYHDRLYTFRVARGDHRERFGLVTLGGTWAHNTELAVSTEEHSSYA